MGGITPDKIEVVGGRAKAEKRREALERELNGGKTWHEGLEACKSKEEIETFSKSGWRVDCDTDAQWQNFKSYGSWPVQEKIEALLNE